MANLRLMPAAGGGAVEVDKDKTLVGREPGCDIVVSDGSVSRKHAIVERLYIPGLQRAGGLQTALSMAKGSILIHNAGESFDVRGPTILPRRLSAREIVQRLKQR